MKQNRRAFIASAASASLAPALPVFAEPKHFLLSSEKAQFRSKLGPMRQYLIFARNHLEEKFQSGDMKKREYELIRATQEEVMRKHGLV